MWILCENKKLLRINQLLWSFELSFVNFVSKIKGGLKLLVVTVEHNY